MFRSRYGDRWIDLSILVLSVLGIIMIGSASVGNVEHPESSFAIKNMIKQIAFVFAGMVGMLIIRRFFKTSYIKRRLLMLGYIIIAGLMLFCLSFEATKGAQAWIPVFGLFTIQPAEFAKLLVMLLLAYYMVDVPRSMQISASMSKEQKKLLKSQKFKECLVKPLGLCLILFIICFILQNDLGTAVILLGIIAVCFFSAGDKYYKIYQRRGFALLCILVLLAVVCFPLIMDKMPAYQRGRIEAWLNPFSDPLNTSFHQLNGLIAFAKNGFWGLGLGNSTQKFGYVPEATTDYIGAIIFEELGIFGFILMVAPYIMIVWRMYHHAYRVPDPKAKIILCGIGAYFFLHMFLNLGGVTCLIPMTGIPLLCVSLGGSSTVTAYVAVGLAQSIIWRYRKEEAANQAQQIPD